jgi:hypothetical protein
MRYTTTVRVTVDEPSAQPLAGVKVALYDKDLFSRDDHLGSGVTDARGEARIQFTTEDFDDLEDRAAGELPDLYAVVYGPDGAEVVSTRSDVLDNNTAKIIQVRIAPDLVAHHQLLPTAG